MSNLTTKILIEIRDEIKETRTSLTARLDETNSRLDETNSRLDETNSRLDHMGTRLDRMGARMDAHEKVLVRLVDLSERHEVALGKLVTGMDELNGRFDDFLRGVHHEAHAETRQKLGDLEQRVTRLEGGGKPPRRRAS